MSGKCRNSANPSIMSIMNEPQPREAPRADETASWSKGPNGDLEAPNRHAVGELRDHGAALGLSREKYHEAVEIARGGMGAVYRVWDAELGRPLALKVMLASESRSLARDRFLEEARVTGQLQHPGIPPVHAIGELADGRPFFAMKLIEGETLAELLKRRAAPQADLPRFLKIFEQITETLAYAHSRGVVHRDSKPLNVMVGQFGETQVMDWGLARRLPGRSAVSRGSSLCALPSNSQAATSLAVSNEHVASTDDDPQIAETKSLATVAHQGASADEPSRDALSRESTDRLTQAGQALGTPAYMPPEQARGEIGRLDERSDVFGLGAILVEILTGRPPYVGTDRGETFRKAQAGDQTETLERLARCGADRELIDLCRDCLAVDPELRPANASKVADRMFAYFGSTQERLEQARVRQATTQARLNEERKRKKISLALAASVVLLAIVGGLAGIEYQRNQAQKAIREAATRARADRLRFDIDNALSRSRAVLLALEERLADPDEAENLVSRSGAWEAILIEARADFQRAHSLAEADAELVSEDQFERLREAKDWVTRATRDRDLALTLDTLRLEAASKSSQRKTIVADLAALYAEAFREGGMPLDQGEIGVSAATLRESKIRWLLLGSVDHWIQLVSDSALRERICQVASQADPDPWRDRFRDHSTIGDRDTLAALAKSPDVDRQSAQLRYALAARMSSVGLDGASSSKVALVKFPSDFWLHYQHGLFTRDSSEQIGAFRAALALRPNNPFVLCDLGVALYERGEFVEAERRFQATLAVDGNYVDAHYNLGKALYAQSKHEAAIAAFRQASLLAPRDAGVYVELASPLDDLGRWQEAIVALEKAIEIDPHSSAARINLGIILKNHERPDEALTLFRKAIELDPGQALGHRALGALLFDLGKSHDAIAAFEAAIAADPNMPEVWYSLGLAHDSIDESDRAIEDYRRAIQLRPDYAEAHCNLGLVFLRLANLDEAQTELRIGHAYGVKRGNWPHPSAKWLDECQRLLDLDARLPSVLRGEGKPENPGDLRELGWLCASRHRWYASAVDLYAEAFERDAKLTDRLDWGYRVEAARAAAMAADGQGEGAPTEAAAKVALRRKALDWLRAEANAWNIVAKRSPEAEAEARKAFESWLRMPDFASVREPDRLTQLSAEEQTTWTEFWNQSQRK